MESVTSGVRWSRPAARLIAGAVPVGAGLLLAAILLANPPEPPNAPSAVPRSPSVALVAGLVTEMPAPIGDPAAATPPPSKPSDYVPDLREAAHDLTVAHRDQCMTRALEPGMKTCVYGDLDGKVTAMLVGDSHSVHWLPAVNRVAKERGWRLVVIAKAGCRFSATTPGTGPNPRSCRRWNELVLDRIRRHPPDVVVTMSTKTAITDERLPSGYLEVWRKLNRMGIPVVGIRDTPRAPFDRVDCLLAHPRRPARCAVPRNPTMDAVSPVLRRDDIPPNLLYVDMTDHLCSAETCPAVADRVVIYRDRHHLTATYSRRLASRLSAQIPGDPDAAYRAQRAARLLGWSAAGRPR